MRIGRALAIWLTMGCASAVAKDLPRPEPVRKTSDCAWAGEGFAKVEGSSTCVKISGAVRAEFGATTARSSFFAPSPGH